MAEKTVLELIAALTGDSSDERAAACFEAQKRPDPALILALLGALQDRAIIELEYPHDIMDSTVSDEAARALRAIGEAGEEAFAEHLRAMSPGPARDRVVNVSEWFGASVLPVILELYERTRPEEPILADALANLAYRGRSAGTPNRLRPTPRDYFALYRAVMDAPSPEARRCRARCGEVLFMASVERDVMEPIFHEVDVESMLLARWDDALERDDVDELWDQIGLWMCGPRAQAIPKLVDVLLALPPVDRWQRFRRWTSTHFDDFAAATSASPALFREVEARILERYVDVTEESVKLFALVGGSAAVGARVAEMVRRGEGKSFPFYDACLAAHTKREGPAR